MPKDGFLKFSCSCVLLRTASGPVVHGKTPVLIITSLRCRPRFQPGVTCQSMHRSQHVGHVSTLRTLQLVVLKPARLPVATTVGFTTY